MRRSVQPVNCICKRGQTRMLLVMIVSGYLLGCFNTGYYLVRWKSGTDIRAVASGGTGSRNVGRMLGTAGFMATLAGDAGKGWLAVWGATHAGADLPLQAAVLLACICGHIWPFQLSFRGGKGFATFAGGMLLLQPLVLLAGFLLSTLFLIGFRRTTISGLAALLCSPLLWILKSMYDRGQPDSPAFAVYCLIVLTVLYGHRNNISSYFTGRGCKG